MLISAIFSQVNWLSVLIATVAIFIIGALWYGPLFSKARMIGHDIKKSDVKKTNLAQLMILNFIFSFVAVTAFDIFLGQQSSLIIGLISGLFISVSWVCMTMAINYMYLSKSLKVYLIDAGYHVVSFAVIGMILGSM